MVGKYLIDGEKVIEHSLMDVFWLIAEESPPTIKGHLCYARWRNPWQWLINDTSIHRDENGEVCCEANKLTC